MAKTIDNPLQPDWWSKSLAGAIAGVALAFAISSLIALGVPGGLSAPDIAQFAMWIVPPIWMTVFAFVYLIRTGLQAWLWLGGANLLAYALLFAMRG